MPNFPAERWAIQANRQMAIDFQICRCDPIDLSRDSMHILPDALCPNNVTIVTIDTAYR